MRMRAQNMSRKSSHSAEKVTGNSSNIDFFALILRVICVYVTYIFFSYIRKLKVTLLPTWRNAEKAYFMRVLTVTGEPLPELDFCFLCYD